MTHSEIIRAARLLLPAIVLIGVIYVAFVAFSFALDGGNL